MGASEQLESAMRSRRKRPRVTVAQKIKSGELTPDEAQQWRKRRRQEKNRQSAQLSRLRKKAHIEELELRVEEMSASIQDMEARMAQLADENARLRRRLANRDAAGDEVAQHAQEEAAPAVVAEAAPVPPTPTPTAGGAFTPHTVAVTPLRELDAFFFGGPGTGTGTGTPKAAAAGDSLAAFLAEAAVAPHGADGSDSDSGSSVGRAVSPLHMDSHHASVANGSAVPPREASSSRGPQQWAFAAPMWLLCVVASLCAPQLHAARLPRHLRPHSMSTLRRARCSKDFALLWALTRGLSARSRHRLLRAVRTGEVRLHLAVHRDERRADVVVTRLGHRGGAAQPQRS